MKADTYFKEIVFLVFITLLSYALNYFYDGRDNRLVIVTILVSSLYLLISKFRIHNRLKTGQIENTREQKFTIIAFFAGLFIIIFSALTKFKVYSIGFSILLFFSIIPITYKKIMEKNHIPKKLSLLERQKVLVMNSFYTITLLVITPLILDIHSYYLRIPQNEFFWLITVYFLLTFVIFTKRSLSVIEHK